MKYLTDEPIDLAELAAAARPSDGAVCMFVGVVRHESDGFLTQAIEYEAYRPMAESEIAHIVSSLESDWPGVRVLIRHRVGLLAVGEPSVAIVVTAPHRHDVFAVCRKAIEWLKEWVPIWKKEIRPDGSGEWVDPTRT